ncbi:MAG: cytochrome B [Rhodobacterales bacterium 32-66-7]|nr:MAG: cytochrome B [Rhodobacterales bacterium 32-66-7]
MTPDRHPGFGLFKARGVLDRVLKLRLLPGALRDLLRHRRLLHGVALGTTLNLASGCTERLSILHPAGPAAVAIADIWWVMLIGAAAIFLLVMGLVLAGLASRAAPSDEGERGTPVWIWGLGLAFPMVTLAALTGYGLMIGERLLPRAAPDLVTVEAEARQWAWTFRYADDPALRTEDVLHIPAGRPVDVRITSRDVVHSFWVPQLAGKLDAIPGRVNVLRIEAATPGTYAGQSAEFSGTGYAGHVFSVEAHDPAAWAAFLQGGAP